MIRIRHRVTRRAAVAGVAAAALFGVAACGDDGPAGTADDPIEIEFVYWGSEGRFEVTQQALDLFEEKNPGITVQPSTYEYADQWDALTPRMTTGDMPDVMQMDYSRLRQFADAGLLYDLEGLVETGDFREGFLETGYIDDTLVAVPFSGNTLGLLYRADKYEEFGMDAPAAGDSWEDYLSDLVELTDKSGEDTWGSGDFVSQYHFMELWLRQQGGSFYTEDGSALNFTEEQLTEWWNMTTDLRDGSGIIPPSVAAELEEEAIVTEHALSGLGWDNFMNWFGAPVAENGGDLNLAAPPTVDPNNLGLYLKPSMQLTIGSDTEFSEESGKLIDFLLNDPEAAAILGTDRGIPATNAALEAVEFDEISQKILDYESSVEGYLSEPPAAPPAAAGDVEAKMGEIFELVGLGELSVEEGVAQFFQEAEKQLA